MFYLQTFLRSLPYNVSSNTNNEQFTLKVPKLGNDLINFHV